MKGLNNRVSAMVFACMGLPVLTASAYVFNVTSYGALPGDGLDDTAGIQAALDAAAAMAGTNIIYLPAGEYRTDRLFIGSDTVFRGDGSSGGSVTLLQMNDFQPGGHNILRNKDKQSGNVNITIEKVRFDGRKTSQTNSYLHLVNMQNVVGLRVEDCAFHDSQAIGCVVQGTQGVDSRTEILNCRSTGNELGFYAQSRDGLIDSLNGLVYSNCVSDADHWGFDFYLASNITAIACVANHASNGHGSGFSSDSCTDLHYRDCKAEGNEKRGFAVFINTNNLRQPCDITFSNCVARGNGRNGFEIANACDVTLTDVSSYENGGYGITALSSFRYDRPHTGLLVEKSTVVSNGLDGVSLRGVQHSEIRSNTIMDNGLDPAVESSGILVANGTYLVPDMPSTHLLIRNNDIGGAFQAYGVESIGLSDYVTLQNNDLTGNQSAPYSLVGSNNSGVASPNIVVILADDLGWRDLGCYGSEFYETPNIDQLCSEGVAFTDAYAAAPLCSASRAALLTGWAPARQHLHAVTPHLRDAAYTNGFQDFTSWTNPPVMQTPAAYPVTVPRQLGQLPLSSITIAERLKEAGYATGFFGKWHLGPDADKLADRQGFDVAMAGSHYGWPPSYFSPYGIPTLIDGPPGEQLTDRLAAEACTFIRNSVAAETSFFCYVPTFAPHGPWEAKQEYTDYFTGTRSETNAQNYAVYAGMVKSLDDAVGTIVAELKAQGVYDSTVIIFTSDNGGIRMETPDKTDGNKIITSMRPLRGEKATTYEGGLRVPAIVRWPGTAPRVSDEVIVTHDWYPTILAVAGLDPLPGNPLDGINLKPFICDETPTGREAVTWFFPHYTRFGTPEWNRSGAVIRKGQWKLRHFWDGTNNPAQPWPHELYDLDADLGETRNLADQYPEVVSELETLLLAELAAQNAHIPQANTNYDEARWFSYWSEQRTASEHLWSTQQGTPIEWLEDYELVDGFNWHAADWKDINGVPAWQAHDEGALPVPFRMEAAVSGGHLGGRHPVREGFRYAILATESLTDPDWQEVAAEAAGMNGFMNFSLPIGDETTCFYAVQEGPVITNTVWDDSFDGAVATGGTVANLNGLPSAITYALDGTQATIQLEGTTSTGGDAELGVTLEDYSENISGYTMAFGALNLGTVAEKTVVTLDAVSVEITE